MYIAWYVQPVIPAMYQPGVLLSTSNDHECPCAKFQNKALKRHEINKLLVANYNNSA